MKLWISFHWWRCNVIVESVGNSIPVIDFQIPYLWLRINEHKSYERSVDSNLIVSKSSIRSLNGLRLISHATFSRQWYPISLCNVYFTLQVIFNCTILYVFFCRRRRSFWIFRRQFLPVRLSKSTVWSLKMLRCKSPIWSNLFSILTYFIDWFAFADLQLISSHHVNVV